MMMEILGTLAKDEKFSVFGFGSFFRDEPYNDIDLVFVYSGSKNELLAASGKMRQICRIIEKRTQEVVHSLLLTKTEFDEAPLRDMNELVLIYTDCTN